MTLSNTRITRTAVVLRRAATGLVVAALAFGLHTGSASASDIEAKVPEATTAAKTFAAQSRSAGLGQAEARQLQQQVDALIAADGGTQIAANQVRFKDGSGDTTLPLPGEKKARDLITQTEDCAYGYFCVWAERDFYGPKTSMYNCRAYTAPFFTSWSNNQSGRARARFYNGPTLVYTTAQAYTSEPRNPGSLYTTSIVPCGV